MSRVKVKSRTIENAAANCCAKKSGAILCCVLFCIHSLNDGAMDFPIYHLDFLGNRLLIAFIAILHTIINHSMAVGGIALIAFMERKGFKTADSIWDQLAKKILFIFFIVTTTVGAMTGVGIWLSTSLVNPMAIGSLIRVFFWAWFTEWIVFVTEVCLILVYYLTWDYWGDKLKKKHVRFGFLLAIASWVTMAIIVAILGFMMDSGSWLSQKSLLSAVLNPIYIPQLLFRTPLAMIMAGGIALFILAFTNRKESIRNEAIQFICRWMLAWIPFLAYGAYRYWKVIPGAMAENLSVAITTQEYANWYQMIVLFSVWAILFLLLFALLGAFKPKMIWRPAMLVPFLILAALLGEFERVREFIRKPYAIAGYLYANGIRKDDYPLLQRDGVLKYSTFSGIHQVTGENKLRAGKEVFAIACSRCHTVDGVNGILTRLNTMYGTSPWNEDVLSSYFENMHKIRTFMPPFPGNALERQALAGYLVSIQTTGDKLDGAQTIGISSPENEGKNQ